jgi:hypothetical protein
MRTFLTFFAVTLLATQASAKPRQDRVQIALPIMVHAATSAPSTEQVGQSKLFGTQLATYRSVAVLPDGVRLPNGLTLFDAGTRLFEHTAKGRAFNGSLYCRATKIGKIVALPCLGDTDGDGAFESLWLGTAVFGAVDVFSPALPRPDVERIEASIVPIRFRVERPFQEENLLIGFFISGSNPLLGQTHLYLAISDNRGKAAIPLTATHKGPRLSAAATSINIADAALSIRKSDKGQYSVMVTTPLSSGERELVQEYETQARIIFVPG